MRDGLGLLCRKAVLHLEDKMAAKCVTVANLSLEYQASQEQGLHQPQIKMEKEEEEEDNEGKKGPCVTQARSLRNILGWVSLDQVKQEPDEKCWETTAQEHLKLIPLPHSGWENPPRLEEILWREVNRREQQTPVLFEEMDASSPEAEHLLVDRRRRVQRDAKEGLEREAVTVGAIVPMHNFPKMWRRGTNWSYAEVIDLLDIWGEQRIQQVLQSSHRNMDTFQVIANEMAKRGHERTAQECRTKTKTMRRDYKKVKENHSAGKGHVTCPFYDQLEHILDSSIQPPERVQNFAHLEESGGDDGPPGPPEEGILHEGTDDCPNTQDFFDPSTQFSIELVDLVDSPPVLCKSENTFEEEPIGAPRPIMEADHLPSPLPPAPHNILDSPATTGSTAGVHVTSSHSPLPGPMGLSAAERLASLRNRHKKTRNDLAMELARAADQRIQMATDRILSALDSYSNTDLEDREKDRAGTEQIIAIMHRQTELLELLVRQQSSALVAVAPTPSRHLWTPRIRQSSHRPAGPPSTRLGVPRRSLTPRTRNRRRPQSYSP